MVKGCPGDAGTDPSVFSSKWQLINFLVPVSNGNEFFIYGGFRYGLQQEQQ